jgi:hypothetical protein
VPLPLAAETRNAHRRPTKAVSTCSSQVDQRRLDARVAHQLFERDELIRVRLVELNRERSAKRMHRRDASRSLLDARGGRSIEV